KSALTLSETHLAYPLTIHEIDSNRLFDDKYFTVDCIWLHHGVPSLGYRITEKDRPGELLVDKLRSKGIEPGPLYQQIKEQPVVTAPNGQELYQKDFLGPDKKGRIISILGDTRFCKDHIQFVKDSDILVHEATFNHGSEERAYQYFHSTTSQAATIAKSGNVGMLILTHISSRYQEED